ncbi:hypothetical protein ACX0G9_30040 [Flavitalea flava]
MLPLFLFGNFMHVCTNKHVGAKTNGTQIISTWMLDPVSKVLIGHPYNPDQVLLYYNNYLIERELSVIDQSITDRKNNSIRKISYDTSYFLINFNSDLCVVYKEFSTKAVAQHILKLNDKNTGIKYNQKLDSSLEYSSNFPLKDTIIDGEFYRYLNMRTKSSPGRQLTGYFTFGKLTPLFHFNKKIDDDYHATLVRMDIKNEDPYDLVSIRMTVKPGNLTEEQIAVFKSWIQSNKWEL